MFHELRTPFTYCLCMHIHIYTKLLPDSSNEDLIIFGGLSTIASDRSIVPSIGLGLWRLETTLMYIKAGWRRPAHWGPIKTGQLRLNLISCPSNIKSANASPRGGSEITARSSITRWSKVLWGCCSKAAASTSAIL